MTLPSSLSSQRRRVRVTHRRRCLYPLSEHSKCHKSLLFESFTFVPLYWFLLAFVLHFQKFSINGTILIFRCLSQARRRYFSISLILPSRSYNSSNLFSYTLQRWKFTFPVAFQASCKCTFLSPPSPSL